MKTVFTSTLLFVCLFFLQAQNPQKITIESGGYDREYLLYLPSSYSSGKTSGLIVCLHGFNRTMEDFFNTYPIAPVADLLNLVVLAPQALPEQDPGVINESKKLDTWGIKIPLDAAWGCGLRVKATLLGATLLDEELNKGVDDVGFINRIISETTGKYAINPANCFIFGTSMGGFMSYQYSMYHGTGLAGLISVCGSMGTAIRNTGNTINVPVCDFHSITDEVVPYGGTLNYDLGLFNASVSICRPKDEVIRFWVNKNFTNPNPKEENINYYPSTNNITVKKYTYSPLASRSEVIHYQINGATHDYYLNKDKGDCMDYNEEVIRFIRSHLRSPGTGFEPVITESVVIAPNPVTNRCTVYKTKQTVNGIKIYDMTGKLKGVYLSGEGKTEIDLSGYPYGVYLLNYNGKTFKIIKK
ncbi:hydrolase [Bacteroidia bacterium]|nr:hydrolase [Bacteroidia bacterium]